MRAQGLGNRATGHGTGGFNSNRHHLMKEIILFIVLIWSDDGYFSAESPLKFENEETCLAFSEDQEKSIKRSFQAFGMPVTFIFSQCGTEQDLKVIKRLFPEDEKT
jgi:hypothetical protein